MQWLLLFLLAFVWGSSFILMKKGLLTFSSMQVAAFRIFIAGFVLVPFAIKDAHILRNKTDLKWLVVVGLLGNFIPAFLFTKAQTVLNSSFTGMLNSTVPLFTLVIGSLFFQLKARVSNFVGVALGLIGVIGLIVSNSGFVLASNEVKYALLPVLATVCYGTNVNLLKSKLSHLGAVQISALSFLLIGPISFIYLAQSDFITVFSASEDGLLSLISVSLLGIVGTAVALVLFNALIKHTSALFASAVTYLIPIFAILWGLADGEGFSLIFIGWIALILAGVYLVNKK